MAVRQPTYREGMVAAGLGLALVGAVDHGCRFVSAQLSKSYQKLPQRKKDNWDSSVCASLCVDSLLFLAYFRTWLNLGTTLESRFDGVDPLLSWVTVFHAAALLYDLGTWYIPDLLHSGHNKVYILHHAVVLMMISVTHMKPDAGMHYFFSCGGVMEGTGPFLAIYYLQKHTELPSSSPWRALNGLCLWVMYFVCRIVPLPVAVGHLAYDSYTHPDYVWGQHSPMCIILGCVASMVVWCLSFYWFILITKKLIDSVCSMIKTKTKNDKQMQ